MAAQKRSFAGAFDRPRDTGDFVEITARPAKISNHGQSSSSQLSPPANQENAQESIPQLPLGTLDPRTSSQAPSSTVLPAHKPVLQQSSQFNPPPLPPTEEAVFVPQPSSEALNQHIPSRPPGFTTSQVFRPVLYQSCHFTDSSHNYPPPPPPAHLSQRVPNPYSYNQSVSFCPPAPNPFPGVEIADPLPRIVQHFDFDPANLARDILLAFNEYRPQPQGLNSHLAPLQGRFGINENSDVSTLRWDLLDPDNPAHPNMPPNSQPGHSMQSDPLRSPTMTRDSSHQGPARPSSSTPKMGSSLRQELAPANASHVQVVVGPIQSTPSIPSNQPTNTSMQKVWTSSVVMQDSPRHGRPPIDLSEKQDMSPRKRGRPLKNPELEPRENKEPDVTKKRGRPRNPESTAPASEGAVQKKRGRPFKTDPSTIPIPEPQFLVFHCEWEGCPAELHNLETLRAHLYKVHPVRLRASKKILCKWAGCGHVAEPQDQGLPPQETIHLQESRSGETQDKEPQAEKLLSQTPADEKEVLVNIGNMTYRGFKEPDDWKEHIDGVHIAWVAKHMGDGPKGTSLETTDNDSKSPSPWLFDENGRQVTPSVADQKIQKGKAKKNNAKRFIKKKVNGSIVWIPKPIPGELGGFDGAFDDDDESSASLMNILPSVEDEANESNESNATNEDDEDGVEDKVTPGDAMDES